jgi:CHAD domain-containing protein
VALVGTDPPAVTTESTYVVRGEVCAETMMSSLQALLPTRLHPIVRHRFTVLDTFDGRVRRAGTRLTQTGINGTSTIAWQCRGGQTLTARAKQPINFAWDLPDGPLQQVLAPVVGVRRLLPQAEGEEHGAVLDVLDERGKTVARIRIASGRARSPTSQNGWAKLPIVITLTALRGYEDAYAQLAPVIESRPGVEPCAEGLHGLMLQRLGADNGDISSLRLSLAPNVRADEGARQIHRTLLCVLIANEPGVRANLDTEFLHDFRVAVRRIRSLLGQIKHVFPPEVVTHFSTEFSWIGQLTGAPRDTDVLVHSLRALRQEVPAGEMEPLTTLLVHAQQLEHRQLADALNDDRYRLLLSKWQAFLESAAPSAPGARNTGRPLAEVVAARAWRLSRRIASSAETIDDETAPARLHDVRIDAKKLRYLVEVTPGFYAAADLEVILAALKKLQRLLGDFNDAQVQEARLLECARMLSATPGSAGVTSGVDRLAAECRQRAARLHAQVIDGLQRFRAGDTRSACRRAFKNACSRDRDR